MNRPKYKSLLADEAAHHLQSKDRALEAAYDSLALFRQQQDDLRTLLVTQNKLTDRVTRILDGANGANGHGGDLPSISQLSRRIKTLEDRSTTVVENSSADEPPID